MMPDLKGGVSVLQCEGMLDILAYTPRFLFNVFMTYTLDDTIRTTACCPVARLRGKQGLLGIWNATVMG